MSQEIFEKNLNAMKKWYPAFCDRIYAKKKEERQTELKVESEISCDGELIFRLYKNGRSLYLNGKRSAKEPIQRWLEHLGTINKYAAVFLFGLGSGMYLKALIENTEKETNVVAYEPSLDIFLEMLSQVDLSETISDRPIAFIVEGLNEIEFEPVLEKVLVLENQEFLKEEIHPNYKVWFAEKLIKQVKLLHKKVELEHVSINTGVKFRKKAASNVLKNMKYLVQGYHTKGLAEVLPQNGTAILVSAGPSLNKNVVMLKKAKNRAFILAVDTALKPLLKAGVVPDAFITIDPDKDMRLFDIEGMEDIPIIAPEGATSIVLERQKGKKIFYFSGSILGQKLYSLNGKFLPDVQTGGSVACSGFSLLYKLGFSTIILVGQDLAYTGNRSHADGTFQEKMEEEIPEGMIAVKGNYEDSILTRRDFRIYLEWFSMYIEGAKKHRNIQVVNATEGGAYIEGTELYTLKDILDELQLEETDYSSCIEKMEPEFTAKERKKAVEYLHSIPEKFEEVRKNAIKLKKAYQRVEKISKSGNMNADNVQMCLKAVKKAGKNEIPPEIMQMIETTIPMADYILRSEYFYENRTAEEEVEEIGKRGIRYCELLMECAEFLKKLSEETLLSIEMPEA